MRVSGNLVLHRPIGMLLIGMLLAVPAIVVVNSGAIEVFIDANRGAIQKIPIAVYPFKQGLALNGQAPTEVLKADLRRSLLFEVADLEKLGIKGAVNSDPDPGAIQKAGDAGLEVQVWGAILPQGRDAVMEGTLYDFARGEKVGGKRFIGSPEVIRYMAHRFADELVFHYTGEEGIARSRIAFVSERSGAKELFVMDYDGYNARRVTFDESLNLAPAWSPDKRRLAFVTYREGGDPKIQELDLTTGKRRTLVSFLGLNITPEWAPNGEELVFATTKDGNAEIYKVDKDGKRFERLTDHRGADLTPTWSPTGREIAFTSDRGWSPKGNWIAYVCRDDRRLLKICLISPDGQERQVLTSGNSNDESPSWSPDGRHVAFSSTRTGKRDIYMINADGAGLERLTANGAFNDDPAWSLP